MNKSRLNFISIVGFLSITTVILLSLPYPWCGLSSWLETLIIKMENCGCLCPWWLFVMGQIISSYFLFLLAQSIKKHSRVKYVILQFLISLCFFIFHLLIHNYYISHNIFASSVYCSWMWLMGLVIFILFSLLPIYRKEDKKSPQK